MIRWGGCFRQVAAYWVCQDFGNTELLRKLIFHAIRDVPGSEAGLAGEKEDSCRRGGIIGQREAWREIFYKRRFPGKEVLI